jgi:hypothetical protein
MCEIWEIWGFKQKNIIKYGGICVEIWKILTRINQTQYKQ